MATHVTPFLLLNLGTEMIFVIAQRLEAQKIDDEKATLVLEEIASAFLDQKIINDLFKPRAPFTHLAVRQYLENVAHASLMQLDKHSMDRLWDLVTMIFKWQTTMTTDIVSVTKKHLTELKGLLPKPESNHLLQKAQIQFEQFAQQFNLVELRKIRNCLLVWLSAFKVRVSILLKLGLQNQDGSFVIGNFHENCTPLLRNLGSNIYALHKPPKTAPSIETDEIETFVNQILGEAKTTHNYINLDFQRSNSTIDKVKRRKKMENQTAPMYLNIHCRYENSELEEYFSEMAVIDNDEENVTEDLLNFITENTESLQYSK